MFIEDKKPIISYKKINCKTALNKLQNTKFGFKYSLNIYRGCLHSCPYCYARYTHWYLGYDKSEDFDKNIRIKANIDKILENELTKNTWKRELVSLGTATDAYQPIEKKMMLARKCLAIFEKYKTPIIFSTKSSLVSRDIDVISEINKKSFAAVAMTFTTLDENLRKVIEPFASPINKRIDALKQIKQNGIITGIHLLPIMKYVNDSRESISQIVKLAKECEIDYFIYGGFNITSHLVQDAFLKTMLKYNPQIYSKYKAELKDKTIDDKNYIDSINAMVKEEIKLNNLKITSLSEIMKKAKMDLRIGSNSTNKYSQLTLF